MTELGKAILITALSVATAVVQDMDTDDWDTRLRKVNIEEIVWQNALPVFLFWKMVSFGKNDILLKEQG